MDMIVLHCTKFFKYWDTQKIYVDTCTIVMCSQIDALILLLFHF